MASIEAKNAPPELPYSLRMRKLSIAITWTMIVLTSCGVMLALYFPLRYATKLDHVICAAIGGALVGVFSLQNMLTRLYHLVKKNGNRRPAGTSRWALDFFMWSYLFTFVAVAVVIATSMIKEEPAIRQLSMPVSVVSYCVSTEILLSRLFDLLGMKTFMPFSSTPKGERIPPASLVIMEDVVAVDGGGGPEYREAVMKRYHASEPFRRLLRQMDWFWGLGGMGISIAVTLVVFLNPSEIVSMAIGWSVPFVWAAIWAAIAVPWVQRSLAAEKRVFEQQTV